VHTTPARKKIRALKAEASEFEKEARTLESVRGMAAGDRERMMEAARLRSEASRLVVEARLEDLQVFKVEKLKETRKGEFKRYEYWHASWREGAKVRNVYLGSCGKMSRGEAMEKARGMKGRALGM
jgi:hypothetical protein